MIPYAKILAPKSKYLRMNTNESKIMEFIIGFKADTVIRPYHC